MRLRLRLLVASRPVCAVLFDQPLHSPLTPRQLVRAVVRLAGNLVVRDAVRTDFDASVPLEVGHGVFSGPAVALPKLPLNLRAVLALLPVALVHLVSISPDQIGVVVGEAALGVADMDDHTFSPALYQVLVPGVDAALRRHPGKTIRIHRSDLRDPQARHQEPDGYPQQHRHAHPQHQAEPSLHLVPPVVPQAVVP